LAAGVVAGTFIFAAIAPREMKHRILSRAVGFEGACVVPFKGGEIVVYRDTKRERERERRLATGAEPIRIYSWPGGKVEIVDVPRGLWLKLRGFDHAVARVTAAREFEEETKTAVDPTKLHSAFESGHGHTSTGEPVVVFRADLPAGHPMSAHDAELVTIGPLPHISKTIVADMRRFNSVLFPAIHANWPGVKFE